eukprot:TRINITY_DN8235_c0_g1_i1.p1 TRINITY_DN8235_c0_g1~~TRINITY_DN8235_c0_g1_i1.p1  ORF type:complete len:129 (+),score=7.23 TRINITY_DN8235_c0_g1_i1:169-555(+)
MHKTPGKIVKLQSAHTPGQYVALGPKGKCQVGPGGKFCEFKVVKHEKRVISLKSAHHGHFLGFDKHGHFHVCSNPNADGQRKKSKFQISLAQIVSILMQLKVPHFTIQNQNQKNIKTFFFFQQTCLLP